MTTIAFPRPTPALLSMNDRHHWARKMADVAAWRKATAVAVTNAYMHGRRQQPSMVLCTFDVPDRRRRDPANFFATVKVVVDALVDCGWWPDDTPEYVTVVEPVLRVVRRGDPLMVAVELRPR